MITVHLASLEYLQQLRDLNAKIFINNPSFDDDLIVDFASSLEGEKSFKDSILRIEGCCLVAEENSQVIGYTDGGPKDIPYRKSKYFEIDNLGVIPEYQGKGVGKLLLESITQWAKDHGFQKIYVNSYIKNEEAVQFYKKIGYTEIDICLEKKIV